MSVTNQAGLRRSSSIATTALLGIGAVYTSSAIFVTGRKYFRGMVFADVASAVNGFTIQQSTDGTNWDEVTSYGILASTNLTFSVAVVSRYLRVVYTNGGVGQGVFRLRGQAFEN